MKFIEEVEKLKTLIMDFEESKVDGEKVEAIAVQLNFITENLTNFEYLDLLSSEDIQQSIQRAFTNHSLLEEEKIHSAMALFSYQLETSIKETFAGKLLEGEESKESDSTYHSKLDEELEARNFFSFDENLLRKHRNLDMQVIALDFKARGKKFERKYVLSDDEYVDPRRGLNEYGIGKALAIAKIVRDPNFFAGGIGYVISADFYHFIKKSFTPANEEYGPYKDSKDILISSGPALKSEMKFTESLSSSEFRTSVSEDYITDRFASLSFANMGFNVKNDLLNSIEDFIKAENPIQFLRELAADVMPSGGSERLVEKLEDFDFALRKKELSKLYNKEIARQKSINSYYYESQYFHFLSNDYWQPTYQGALAIADYYAEKLGIKIIIGLESNIITKIMQTIAYNEEGDFKVGIATQVFLGGHMTPMILQRKSGKMSIYVSDSRDYRETDDLFISLERAFPETPIIKIGISSRQADHVSCGTDGLAFLKETLIGEVTSEKAYYVSAKRAQVTKSLFAGPSLDEEQSKDLARYRDKYTSMTQESSEKIYNTSLQKKGEFYKRAIEYHMHNKTPEQINEIYEKFSGCRDLKLALANESLPLREKVILTTTLYNIAENAQMPFLVENWLQGNRELASQILPHVPIKNNLINKHLKELSISRAFSELTDPESYRSQQLHLGSMVGDRAGVGAGAGAGAGDLAVLGEALLAGGMEKTKEGDSSLPMHGGKLKTSSPKSYTVRK